MIFLIKMHQIEEAHFPSFVINIKKKKAHKEPFLFNDMKCSIQKLRLFPLLAWPG
jgi:hypothetical protein